MKFERIGLVPTGWWESEGNKCDHYYEDDTPVYMIQICRQTSVRLINQILPWLIGKKEKKKTLGDQV